MTMDRNVWNQSFTKWYVPWPCPACHVGRLQLVPESLHTATTEESKRGQGPYDYEGRFACMLKCTGGSCEEPVVVIGSEYLEEQDDGEGGSQWVEYLSPRFIHPAPHLFS